MNLHASLVPLLVGMYAGGVFALSGVALATWSSEPTSKKDRDAQRAWMRAHPVVTAVLVVVFLGLWPAVVAAMLAHEDEEKKSKEPPADG